MVLCLLLQLHVTLFHELISMLMFLFLLYLLLPLRLYLPLHFTPLLYVQQLLSQLLLSQFGDCCLRRVRYCYCMDCPLPLVLYFPLLLLYQRPLLLWLLLYQVPLLLLLHIPLQATCSCWCGVVGFSVLLLLLLLLLHFILLLLLLHVQS